MENLDHIKKVLEVELICSSLNGRIEYEFIKNHIDNSTTIVVSADDEEITEQNIPSVDILRNILNKYNNENNEYFLNSNNPMEQILGIFDKRIGKRTVKKLQDSMVNKPEWLQDLYNFRLRAEGYTA